MCYLLWEVVIFGFLSPRFLSLLQNRNQLKSKIEFPQLDYFQNRFIQCYKYSGNCIKQAYSFVLSISENYWCCIITSIGSIDFNKKNPIMHVFLGSRINIVSLVLHW